ncbi:hypothetical protein [Fodinibius sediminis]|uniref:Uncharacterized protein n=1 Tax=Fodinibius sediminis TaxID=1214077 RepID=A0A521FFK7_9BACT|nr:hypothetical protein [Fodinibius sediminis]SMO94764.1 hypothetical protein SAMN06265218_1331 [Fodinibius sediminis]
MTTLRTGVEITNSIFPNRQIKPEYCKVDNIPIIGATHVIYITRILLDNIIKHSGVQSNLIDVEISAKIIDKELLRLSFTNKLSNDIDFQQLEDTLAQVKEKWRDKSNFEKTNIEGGSGFDKIRRILAFDLKGKNYGFSYIINENKLTIVIDVDIDIKRKEL